MPAVRIADEKRTQRRPRLNAGFDFDPELGFRIRFGFRLRPEFGFRFGFDFTPQFNRRIQKPAAADFAACGLFSCYRDSEQATL